VIRELELIARRRGDEALPLIVLHDVGWPHARRDTYYTPERIPPEHRQPVAENASLDPQEPGIADGGIPFRWAAEREGGPHNGVLTAVEDFMGERGDLELATVPIFWGIGILWSRDAAYAADLADAVRPWAENPMLERLEEHRVAHLVSLCRTVRALSDLEGVSAEQELIVGAQRELLERMRVSSALGIAERISRLRQGGKPLFSREEIDAALSIGVTDVEAVPEETLPIRPADADASAASPAPGQAPSTAS
jgi:hypothetical protein